ncbi:NADH:flavin oxidoreductase/NADH oxidase [Rhizorhabdus dicambivorans]|uniref:NADH:flavin oxidoreductase/NADH oxidase n=2 Tax=Rhizorhabdus dicambivorans TaxID=1850238 RepID=A0A2A4FR25_9SPHN|nr:NADH:flavin oxidoreductase/NADH oxidase [Rhizorhabdus dicambivorans]PCE40136.1 NADH:flavin oxidoreductase/NADH oxidase [Rhizorhabdus dicambivorans]
MSSKLFSPFKLRGLELENRIVTSPMMQFSATENSEATDWHVIHYGTMAISGAGLVITEATSVRPDAAYNRTGLGLWTDAQEEALARVIAACRKYSPAKHGLQLWHSGRKASVKGLEDGLEEMTLEEGGWRLIAPSDAPYPGRTNPITVPTAEMLDEVIEAFCRSAERAARIGYDLLEIHGAHGYLLHSFLSPISNLRTDEFGGDITSRMRFPLKLMKAVRQVWPEDRPLGLRLSATDWVDSGWTVEDSVVFAKALKAIGCDYVTASSGGSSPQQQIDLGPGYQTRFAAAIRSEAEIPTMAVGQISEPHLAEFIVANGMADLIAIGRGLVADPRWPWRAAEVLLAKAYCPIQYQKSTPISNRTNLFRKVTGWDARHVSLKDKPASVA